MWWAFVDRTGISRPTGAVQASYLASSENVLAARDLAFSSPARSATRHSYGPQKTPNDVGVLFFVDRTGLEPATPALQMRCSTR